MKKVTIRFPDELADEIEKRAKKQRRSFNKQVIFEMFFMTKCVEEDSFGNFYSIKENYQKWNNWKTRLEELGVDK